MQIFSFVFIICFGLTPISSWSSQHKSCRNCQRRSQRLLSTPQSRGPEEIHDQKDVLREVETTVARVFEKYKPDLEILSLPPKQREVVGVARLLHKRLKSFRRNNDCPRCWFQMAHCICEECPPIPEPLPCVNRLFLLTHHKEICLAVDTTKIILACFPQSTRLVVGGIGPEFQDTMKEMLTAMQTRPNNCLVLFPSEDAKTFAEWQQHASNAGPQDTLISHKDKRASWDIIVLDGTWSQARKMYSRYLAESQIRRVALGEDSVALLSSMVDTTIQSPSESLPYKSNPGHQLRRHPVDWRNVSTMEATRLLLKEMHSETLFKEENDQINTYWLKMSDYQEICNKAAKKQLGPPRTKQRK